MTKPETKPAAKTAAMKKIAVRKPGTIRLTSALGVACLIAT
ncbi:hypothetical protein [Actinomadura sp. 3N407]